MTGAADCPLPVRVGVMTAGGDSSSALAPAGARIGGLDCLKCAPAVGRTGGLDCLLSVSGLQTVIFS